MDSRGELRPDENRDEITAGKKPARGCSEAKSSGVGMYDGPLLHKPSKQLFNKEE